MISDAQQPPIVSSAEEPIRGVTFWWQAVLYLVREQIWVLAIVLAVVFVLDLLLYCTATRVYVSRGEFVVDQSPFHFTGDGSEEDTRLLLQSIISSIQSDDMRAVIAERLGVPPTNVSFLGFDVKVQKLNTPDTVNIDLTTQRTSRVAVVEADSSDRKFASRAVGAILDELSALNQLAGRIDSADQRMKVASAEVAEYAQAISQAQVDQVALEQKVNGIKAHLSAGGTLESSPAFADDAALLEMVKKRIDAEAAYESQAQVSIRGQQLAALKGQLDDVLDQISNYLRDKRVGMESAYNEAKERVSALEANLKAQNDVYNAASSEKSQLSTAIGDFKLRRQLGLFDPKTQVDGGVIVVLDRGQPALRPSKPNALLYGAIGVVLAGVLAPTLMFFRHNLDQRIRSPQQIEWSVGVPCLAVLSQGSHENSRQALGALQEETLSGLSYLRNQLLRGSLVGQSNKIIAFTDLGIEESQCNLVAQLGWLMAQAEKKTLLVDLDFKNSRLHEVLRVAAGKGLSEWVTSNEPISSFVTPSANKNLGLIQPGKKSGELDTFFSRRPLASSIEQLSPAWDFIFIYAPSLLKVHNLLLAAPLDTPVIALAAYNEAQVSELREEVARCDAYNFRFAGVVLHHYPNKGSYHDRTRIGAHQYVFERKGRTPATA